MALNIRLLAFGLLTSALLFGCKSEQQSTTSSAYDSYTFGATAMSWALCEKAGGVDVVLAVDGSGSQCQCWGSPSLTLSQLNGGAECSTRLDPSYESSLGTVTSAYDVSSKSSAELDRECQNIWFAKSYNSSRKQCECFDGSFVQMVNGSNNRNCKGALVSTPTSTYATPPSSTTYPSTTSFESSATPRPSALGGLFANILGNISTPSSFSTPSNSTYTSNPTSPQSAGALVQQPLEATPTQPGLNDLPQSIPVFNSGPNVWN